MSEKNLALMESISHILKQKKLVLAIAESCTAGGLCYDITRLPGSSTWFDRGFITYSNAAKMDMLNVKPSTLANTGAVSEETAKEMAKGALKNSQAHISLSITGIAGPDGGSADKPVGSVWMAISKKNTEPQTYFEIFPGTREDIRQQAILRALEYLLVFIKKE